MSDIEYEMLALSDNPADRDKALKFYQQHYIKQNGKPEKISAIAWERKTAAEILKTDYPPLNWLVEDLIPAGLTKIDGSPKVGKSLLALHLASCVSHGGCFLGKIKVETCEVLYLALEDSFRRIKDRLIKQGGYANEKLYIETPQTWRGGILALKSYVDKFPDTKLIIIDTMFKFQPIEDSNEYGKTYKPIALIQELAAEKHISIVLIHHTRKGANNNTGENWQDEGMGSTGFAAAVDTTILLKRKDGTNEGKLFIKGRDVEEKSFDLLFDRDLFTWRLIGKSEIVTGDPKAQAEVLSLLEDNPEGLRTGEIADMLGKNKQNISNILKTLEGKGKVYKQDNKWYCTQVHTSTQMYDSVQTESTQVHIPLRESVQVYKKELEIY